MALFSRLAGDSPDDDKISVHHFMSALSEYQRGQGNKNQLVNAFNLDTGEADDLQLILDEIDLGNIGRAIIHDVLLLVEGGFYTKSQARSRLGV